MESVLIVAPPGYEAKLRSRLARHWNLQHGAPHGWVIVENDSRVYVTENQLVANEIEPERLKGIVAIVSEPTFYTVDFSDLKLCKRVLMSIADDPELLVDNDHGVVLPGHDFVGVLRSKPDWDWRRDMPRPS